MEKHKKLNKATKLLGILFLSKLREIEEKELLNKYMYGEFEYNDILIQESSKEIFRTNHVNYNNNDSSKIKNEVFFFRNKRNKKGNQRNVNLLYLALLEFNGLKYYMQYQNVIKDDIRKMSCYIKHKKFKEGNYIYRYNDYSDALYAIIKGKVEVRSIEYVDHSHKIHYDSFRYEEEFKDKENDDNEKIPFEYFMSDLEVEDEYEYNNKKNYFFKEEKNENKDNINNEVLNEENNKKDNINNECLNEENNKKDNIKNECLNEENNKKDNINNENMKDIMSKISQISIDDNEMKLIKFKRDKKMRNMKKEMTEILSKKKEKFKLKKPKIINAIKKHQTPDEILSEKILKQFILDFENIKNEYKEGTIFGDNSVIFSLPRSKSILCKTDVDVFYLEKKYVDRILLQRFLKSNFEKINFISKIIPNFEINTKIFTQITPIFADKNTIIYTPYDSIDYIYIIFKGECGLSQLNILTHSKEEYLSLFNQLKVCSILGIGGIGGLEISKQQQYYNYSLVVLKQNTILFKIDINIIKKCCPYYKHEFELLYDKRMKVQKVLFGNKSFIYKVKSKEKNLNEKIIEFEKELKQPKINKNIRKFTSDKLKINLTELHNVQKINPHLKIDISKINNTKNLKYHYKYETCLKRYQKNSKRNHTPNLFRACLLNTENNLPTLNNGNNTSIIQTNDKTFSDQHQKSIINKTNGYKSIMNKTMNNDKDLLFHKIKTLNKDYENIKKKINRNKSQKCGIKFYNSGTYNIPLVSN